LIASCTERGCVMGLGASFAVLAKAALRKSVFLGKKECMPRVLIVPRPLATCPGDEIKILEENGFEAEYFPEQFDPYEHRALRRCLSEGGYQAVLAGSEPYTADVLSGAETLRVIARVGVGYDAVDLEAAGRRNIAVTIAPGTNDAAVAEHTVAMILCIGRRLVERDRWVRSGVWPRVPLFAPVRTSRLGIVGLGRIGKEVALRALALGMDVVAYEPFPDRAFVAERGVKLVELDELLATSDYVTLHLPLTDETEGLMNGETLGRMKPGSVLINTARGGLVVEEALVEALQSGRLAAAGLDVLRREPPPRDHPLLGRENVLFSPHIAGIDRLSVQSMAKKAAKVVVDLYAGHWPADCVVNPELGPRWQW
jgi:D-3-phosphoglycerate dehydrogenase